MPGGGVVTAGLIGGGALAGGLGSFFGGKSQANAAESAAAAQLQASREGISAQREGFGIFQQEAERARGFLREQAGLAREELAPLREIGLRNLRRAEGFTDPNSPEAQAERGAFQKQQANLLSARGLTASGTELAGLKDFELGLARERRNISLGLAGQGANTLQSLSSIQQGLGQGLAGTATSTGQAGLGLGGNISQTLQQGAGAAGNLNLAASQFRAQGLAGAGNALQTGLLGFGQLRQNQANQAFQQNLISNLFGGGGGGQNLIGANIFGGTLG